jgi:hypothetical protein
MAKNHFTYVFLFVWTIFGFVADAIAAVLIKPLKQYSGYGNKKMIIQE